MRDFLTIGEVPVEEECAGVGAADYPERSRAECRAFIGQIRRELGEERGTAELGIKSFPHDFGTYREVVCYYDDNDGEGQEYAFNCESNGPTKWDDEAKAELAAAGFPAK